MRYIVRSKRARWNAQNDLVYAKGKFGPFQRQEAAEEVVSALVTAGWDEAIISTDLGEEV